MAPPLGLLVATVTSYWEVMDSLEAERHDGLRNHPPPLSSLPVNAEMNFTANEALPYPNHGAVCGC